MCLSHLIYTVRSCLIHTCHAIPMPCSDHAVLLKATTQHGRFSTALLCCGLEKNGMVGAWHGYGMASANQTRPHGMLCVNRPLQCCRFQYVVRPVGKSRKLQQLLGRGAPRVTADSLSFASRTRLSVSRILFGVMKRSAILQTHVFLTF